MEVVNRYVATRHHIEGAPTEADFEVKEEMARWAPDSGEVLVRNLYLSIDPYQLNRMKRSSVTHLAVEGILPGQVSNQLKGGESPVSLPLCSPSLHACTVRMPDVKKGCFYSIISVSVREEDHYVRGRRGSGVGV
jgi:hypothetical protein